MSVVALLDHLNNSFSYEPIQYHDAWLSIDPMIGCSLNCQYCYLRSVNWTGVKPQQLYSVSEIIELLHTSKYFIANKTHLSIGNATDGFLPDNIEIVRSVVLELDKLGYSNTMTFVTKRRVPLDVVIEFSQLQHIRPIFFLSYSGLPPSIEKGVNAEDNRQNFQTLAEYRIPTVHYWRPIMEINGTAEKLESMLDFVSHYAKSSVYVGLKSNPALYQLFAENDLLRLTPEYQNQYVEYFPSEIEQRLRDIATRKYPDYPLYKHASCAMSHAFHQQEYNATLHNRAICRDGSHCPDSQRVICGQADTIPTENAINVALDYLELSLPYHMIGNNIVIEGEITQQDYIYLLHTLKYPIKANVIYTRMWRGRIFESEKES